MLGDPSILEAWAWRQPWRLLQRDHDLQRPIERCAIDTGTRRLGGLGAGRRVGLIEHGLGQLQLRGATAGLEQLQIAIEARGQAGELALRPGDEAARRPIRPGPPRPVAVGAELARDPVGAVNRAVDQLHQHGHAGEAEEDRLQQGALPRGALVGRPRELEARL